jgi:hypothetical protein
MERIEGGGQPLLEATRNRWSPRGVDPITVMDDKTVVVVARQRLPKLLQSPFRLRMRRDIVVHDSACSDFHDQEKVEDAKRGRHDNEEIAGHDGLGVVADEGHPTLLWVRRAPWSGPAG